MDGSGGRSDAPSGTVTFVFTDVVGSTALWDSFPDAMGRALARHDEIVREAVDAFGGHVFSTAGDGFGVVFGRAADAVSAALATQRALAVEEWPDGAVLRVRVGIHTGDAEERDGNYFGPPVNRAARIMGAANGGQILVSDLTAGLVAAMSGVELVDLGSVELKGVIEPVRVHGVGGDGHAWIDAPLSTGRVSRTNLPRLPTESVGDLADLQRRVADLARASVVTLTGSGGVGKTRAAIEIGWLVVDEFADGVWFVELVPVADPALAATTIASTLGAGLQPGATTVESIVEWCVGRRMLLILDNCEHVLDAVTEVAEAIVAGCATVTILATSREPIGVAGETVVRIASLEHRYATELFVMRARSADAGFEPTDADAEAIAGICRRLDGIPLAIELAASRIRSLGPAELMARLDDRFRLLRGGGRGGLERHQTLRATVAWSYQMLSEDAQVLFDRLSVFAGGFDLDAAEAIGTGGHLDELDIVDLLGDLVDKSMVNAVRTERGTRYRLLETLRQYGEERLDDRGGTAAVRDAHLHHFVALARHLHQQWWSPDQADARDRFDDDWENLGAAHTWAITTGEIDHAHTLVGATGDVADGRGRHEHHEWCSRTLELADTTVRHDPRTLFWQGWWAFVDGDADRAIALGERCASIDTPGAATLGRVLSLYANMAAGRSDIAKEIASDLRSELPTVDDPVVRSYAALAIQSGFDPVTIASDADAALAAARSIGAPKTVAAALRNAALRWHFTDRPDLDRFFADLDEAIRLHESVGTSPHSEWAVLAGGRTLAGDPAALDTLKRALQLAYDRRHWAVLNLALETAPTLLTRHDPVVAATIYGYLERSPPPWGPAGVSLRAIAAEHVEAIPDNETHRARGAATDRHDIVDLTLTTITES